MRRAPRAGAIVCAVSGALLLCALATAANPAASRASFVLRAKAVYPVTPDQPGPIERGMLVVRDGRIIAVGRNLEVPPDLPLIDVRDAIVCPGFVAAAGSFAGAHAGPESVSAAYRAIDAYDAYADYTETLARGTTTVHLDPGPHRLVAGIGAVVKLAGPVEQRVLLADADLDLNLGVFNPPPLFRPPFYASSDIPIEPARGQRPDSRLGQYLELEERMARAGEAMEGKFDFHRDSFVRGWQAGLPLRLQVLRAEDIEGALAFLKRHTRLGYLVGLTEGSLLPEILRAAEVPLVLRIERAYRAPGPNIGPDPEALEPRLATAGALGQLGPNVVTALAGAVGDRREDLRMAAILAVRGGMSPERALAAITRMPAEILHVANRVGSLAPGNDADLLVLTGEPLDINSFVRQVYVAGRPVFDAPRPRPEPGAQATSAHTTGPTPLVLRAGTIWVGDGSILRDGSVLIENGKIQAVGQRVPHPPFARIIDAGPTGFLVPGFIDAHGHLGLDGDQTVATPDLPPHRTVGAAGREFVRVAQAGITTVLLAPYRGAPNGARMAAVKTYGSNRDELVARDLTGLRFTLRGQDPLTGVEAIRRTLQAGKKYDDDWKKYDAELAKWKEGKDKGTDKPKEGETVVEKSQPDAITGKWEYTVSGDPLPQPVSGTVVLRLTGASIEGRLTDPLSGEEVNVSGSLSGNDITLEIDVETPAGKPIIRATLDREDHAVGKASVGSLSLNFEATRTDKSAVEFRVQRSKKHTKDGRPAPPKRDENLEPVRALLAGKIPAVVEVATAGEINAALKLFVDDFKLSLVLIGAEDAADIADQIIARTGRPGAAPTSAPTTAPAYPPTIGVVVPTDIERTRARAPYVEAADLTRRGIRVALQSNGEDGARDLPLMGLYAVRQGLGGDAALRALTSDAARMYKLDDRLGSLEPGKDADVLVFDGYPFDADSRLQRVIVGGREVTDE